MPEHDPMKFATGLSAQLATRSRHVCAFLGAGAARACGLPDVTQLQERVISSLEGEEHDGFARQLEGRNLEQALSRLRRIAALLTNDQTLDGLSAAQGAALDKKVCQLIVKELDIKDANLSPVYRFAALAAFFDYVL